MVTLHWPPQSRPAATLKGRTQLETCQHNDCGSAQEVCSDKPTTHFSTCRPGVERRECTRPCPVQSYDALCAAVGLPTDGASVVQHTTVHRTKPKENRPETLHVTQHRLSGVSLTRQLHFKIADVRKGTLPSSWVFGATPECNLRVKAFRAHALVADSHAAEVKHSIYLPCIDKSRLKSVLA